MRHASGCSMGRVKSSRANRTSKGAEKWLDVQEHKHGTAACIAYLKVCFSGTDGHPNYPITGRNASQSISGRYSGMPGYERE